MCDKCRQLENDIQRYRQRLEQTPDPLAIEIQRTQKLSALGLDPQTLGRVDGWIQELVQDEPAYALTASRSPLPLPRVIH
jgi:hypothetical protein